jgi:hypothetical protein
MGTAMGEGTSSSGNSRRRAFARNVFQVDASLKLVHIIGTTYTGQTVQDYIKIEKSFLAEK